MKTLSKFTVAGMVCAVSLMALDTASAASLKHRYSFNGGKVEDSVGKAHGTLVGGATVSDGQARLTGEKGQRIELLASGADGININAYKAITFEAWYTAEKLEKQKTWQRVFDFGATTGGAGGYCVHYVAVAHPEGSCAELSNAESNYPDQITAGGPLAPAGQEVHIAVVVKDDTIYLYTNGVETAKAGLEGRTIAKLSNSLALLGGSLWDSNPSLHGSINEFRIYDDGLTAEQIAASFKAGPEKVKK
jgi:hypothetical protein